MTDDQYIDAVVRIRYKELFLLTKSDIEQLMNCKDEAECIRFLNDKGWGSGNDDNSHELLVQEKEKTWNFMKEIVEDMSVFDTLLYGNDFHNLKAAIKQVYKNSDLQEIYLYNATIDPSIIYQAVNEQDFDLLPDYMREVAEEAYKAQLHNNDSQLCDIILDKAALDTIYHKGKESNNELLAQYSEIKVAVANINIAIRSLKTGKSKEFLEQALVECDSLDIQKLSKAALEDIDRIYEYLDTTVYKDAVKAIQASPSSFERWCDNLIIENIKPQKYNPFTLSPLVAYILARENEIKTVRIILSGKRNDIADDSIRERLRDMYV